MSIILSGYLIAFGSMALFGIVGIIGGLLWVLKQEIKRLGKDV